MKIIASFAINMQARALFCLIFVFFAGCASGPARNPTDPIEPFNRSMFSFNEGLDKTVLKPMAMGYRAVAPQPIRAGVGNVFGNLQDLWSALNGVLQLRPVVATDNFMRFSVNTVFGLGGLLNVANEMGIERHPEDFGKTLGRWGVSSGPYLVLPLFGPSTLRDSTTIVLENKYDPISNLEHVRIRNTAAVVRVVDTRANLLRLTDLLDEAALDKYSFTRDAFLQKRRAEIYRPGHEQDDNYKPEAEEKK